MRTTEKIALWQQLTDTDCKAGMLPITVPRYSPNFHAPCRSLQAVHQLNVEVSKTHSP